MKINFNCDIITSYHTIITIGYENEGPCCIVYRHLSPANWHGNVRQWPRGSLSATVGSHLDGFHRSRSLVLPLHSSSVSLSHPSSLSDLRASATAVLSPTVPSSRNVDARQALTGRLNQCKNTQIIIDILDYKLYIICENNDGKWHENKNFHRHPYSCFIVKRSSPIACTRAPEVRFRCCGKSVGPGSRSNSQGPSKGAPTRRLSFASACGQIPWQSPDLHPGRRFLSAVPSFVEAGVNGRTAA